MKQPQDIRPEQMERLTERILMDAGFDPNAKWIKAVPIEEIAEFHFDLHIGWEPIDHFDPDGIVMAAIFPEERRIVLNETQRELFDSKLGTYHFTLAHELGHWVLHTAQTDYRLRQARDEPYYCRGSSGRPLEELQADRFAGCLLMPRPMMVRAVGQLRKLGPVQLYQLYGLAECFRVSISALTVRLKQLRLLEVDANGQVHIVGQRNRDAYEQLSLDI